MVSIYEWPWPISYIDTYQQTAIFGGNTFSQVNLQTNQIDWTYQIHAMNVSTSSFNTQTHQYAVAGSQSNNIAVFLFNQTGHCIAKKAYPFTNIIAYETFFNPHVTDSQFVQNDTGLVLIGDLSINRYGIVATETAFTLQGHMQHYVIFFDALQQGLQYLKGSNTAFDNTNNHIFNIGYSKNSQNAYFDAFILCKEYTSLYQSLWSKKFRSPLGSIQLTQSIYDKQLCVLGTIGSQWTLFFCMAGNTGNLLGGFVMTVDNSNPSSCYGMKKIATNIRFACQFGNATTTLVINEASLQLGTVPPHYIIDSNLSKYITYVPSQIGISVLSNFFVSAGVSLPDDILVSIETPSITKNIHPISLFQQVWPQHVDTPFSNYQLVLSPSFSPSVVPTYYPTITQPSSAPTEIHIITFSPTISESINNTQQEPSAFPSYYSIFSAAPTDHKIVTIAPTITTTSKQPITTMPTAAMSFTPSNAITNKPNLRGIPSKAPSKQPTPNPSARHSVNPSAIGTFSIFTDSPTSHPSYGHHNNSSITYTNASAQQIFDKNVVATIAVVIGLIALCFLGGICLKKCQKTPNSSRRRKHAIMPYPNNLQNRQEENASFYSMVSSLTNPSENSQKISNNPFITDEADQKEYTSNFSHHSVNSENADNQSVHSINSMNSNDLVLPLLNPLEESVNLTGRLDWVFTLYNYMFSESGEEDIENEEEISDSELISPVYTL